MTPVEKVIIDIYHASVQFIAVLTIIGGIITFSWIVYFTNNVSLNYRAYKAYKLRIPDVDSLQRRRTKKVLIIRDLLILGVIACEFVIQITLLTELVIGELSARENEEKPKKFEITFNCSSDANDTSHLFLHEADETQLVLQAMRQSSLIGQLGIYGTVVTFLTQVYKLNQPNMRHIYKMLAVIITEIVILLVLISFIQTYIIGYTLSIVFLLLNILYVVRSGKQLYLQIRFRQQDISLVDNMEARQEYKRTRRALAIYKKTVSCFTLLLIILALGELTFCIGSVWIEWIFTIQCSKLKPQVLMMRVGENAIHIVVLQSVVARTIQTVSGGIFYLGIIGMSIAVGVKRILENRKRRKLGQMRHGGLSRPLLKN